jgi:hypothetical protein
MLPQQVGPDATDEHDVELTGRSGRQREIDALIRYRIGSAVNGIVVVDAKDHGRRIPIRTLLESRACVHWRPPAEDTE